MAKKACVLTRSNKRKESGVEHQMMQRKISDEGRSKVFEGSESDHLKSLNLLDIALI